LAGLTAPESWDERAREWLGEQGEWITYRDAAAGRYRFARIFEGRLQGCLFVAPDLALPSRSWLGGLFAARELTGSDRLTLLAGRPLNRSADVGPIVCACFGVGQHQIDAAISGGAASVEAVGLKLKAGTNCGSCKPEIGKRLRPAA
jgi:assimilatory nitrate reductase catalytic subunit